MKNKLLSTLLWHIILTFIVLFATSGAMYLLGNVIIGWTWLTFDICFTILGAVMVLVFIIIFIIFDRKEGNQ